MAKCPNGHNSASGDYCNVCGYRIAGTPKTPASDPVRAVGKHRAPRPAAAPTEYCPRCGTVSSGQVCGTCGFRFLAAPPVPARPSSPPATPGSSGPPVSLFPPIAGPDPLPEPWKPPVLPGLRASKAPASVDWFRPLTPPALSDESVLPDEPALPEQPAPDVSKSPDEAESFSWSSRAVSPELPPSTAVPSDLSSSPVSQPLLGPTEPQVPSAPHATATSMVTPTSWTAVVTTDRKYYDQMLVTRALAGPPVPFPVYSNERRFPLAGKQMRIGRRSAARGLAPEIDLAGPPADPGVSRLHAVLIAGPDGTWGVFDPGSANGTLLNGREIAIGDLIPLRDGDRINLGAWTAITVRHG